MLDKLRNFSKGKLAGVLVAIIIIPFVFWGMGSVFSGGNTNSIAKINKHNISTQDFADYVNNSKISTETIKENIDNNVLEELLTQLVSTTLIDIEIDELKILIPDEAIANRLKKQKSFQDNNSNFSRIKYEKFLLENNLSSVQFEEGIRNNELKKNLFNYIGGGIKSPYFLINKTFKEQFKQVEIDYLDLNSIYINKNEIKIDDIKKHVDENKEKFLIEKVDISFIKITPDNLIGETEFNENFFKKIDEIEDLVINNNNIDQIAKKFGLKVAKKTDYYPGKIKDNLLNEIYKKRSTSKIELLDKNDFFILYEIKNLKKILPSLENKEFVEKAKNDLFEMSKYNLHSDLMKKIQKKEFTNEDFTKIAKEKINKLKFKNINDTNKFTADSVSLIYSLSLNNFSLVSNKNNDIYLIKITNIFENNLNKNSEEIKIFANKTSKRLRDDLYNSYDFLLNEKYKIEVNQKTLERMKNYFK